MLSDEQRKSLQNMRKELLEKSLEELQNMVVDADLKVSENTKTAHVRTLINACRHKLRAGAKK